MNQLNSFIEYMKIHLISLNQDLEECMYVWRTDRDNHDSSKIDYLKGQIQATEHLLSVAEGMIE